MLRRSGASCCSSSSRTGSKGCSPWSPITCSLNIVLITLNARAEALCAEKSGGVRLPAPLSCTDPLHCSSMCLHQACTGHEVSHVLIPRMAAAGSSEG